VARRYQSAEAFEDDLRAFLDARLTVAERESAAPWNANATVERQPMRSKSDIRVIPPPRAQRWNNFSNVAIALLAGILVGLLVFMPLGYYYRLWSASEPLRGRKDYAHDSRQALSSDWSVYQELKSRDRFLGQWSPIFSLGDTMRSHLLSASDNIIDSFRNSSDAQLSDFDWARARDCLRYALQIDPGDTKAKGELALCNGYFNLARNPNLPQAAASIGYFRQAQSYLPRSPDPHLGLARLYVDSIHNIGQALGEFYQAQRLGYKLGPRETEEQADGYLFRSEASLQRAKRTPASDKAERAKWLQLARGDMERARNLYEPIAGFSNVSTNLDQLQQDRLEQIKLESESVRVVHPRPHYTKRYAGLRRWQ